MYGSSALISDGARTSQTSCRRRTCERCGRCRVSKVAARRVLGSSRSLAAVCADAVRRARRQRATEALWWQRERLQSDASESVALTLMLGTLSADRREAFVLTQIVGLPYVDRGGVRRADRHDPIPGGEGPRGPAGRNWERPPDERLPRIDRSESEAFAATIRADTLDRRVPGCPDWSLRELVWHLGRVQRFWTRPVRAGVDERPDSARGNPGRMQPKILPSGSATPLESSSKRSRRRPRTRPAWTWWKEPRTAGAIGRHQVQEAAMHRWDASLRSAHPSPCRRARRRRRRRVPRDLATDAPALTDRVRRDGTPGDSSRFRRRSAATVSAPSGDLVLLLYRRLAPEDVRVLGDPRRSTST